MNVLILAGLTGGVETHVRNLVRMLVERNTNPHVIALSESSRIGKEERYTLVGFTGTLS